MPAKALSLEPCNRLVDRASQWLSDVRPRLDTNLTSRDKGARRDLELLERDVELLDEKRSEAEGP